MRLLTITPVKLIITIKWMWIAMCEFRCCVLSCCSSECQHVSSSCWRGVAIIRPTHAAHWLPHDQSGVVCLCRTQWQLTSSTTDHWANESVNHWTADPVNHWPTERRGTAGPVKFSRESGGRWCGGNWHFDVFFEANVKRSVFPSLALVFFHVCYKLCAAMTLMRLLYCSTRWGQINNVTSSPSRVGRLVGPSESFRLRWETGRMFSTDRI